MANRYWAGGTGTWNTSSTTKWSAASPLTFTASCTGTTLTTVGSPALVAGMTVWSSTYVSLGTVVSGAIDTWVVSVGGTYASQAMQAATIGASVPTAADSVIFDTALTYTITLTGALTCLDITVSAGTVTFATGSIPTLAISGSMNLVAATVWSANTTTITFNSTTTGRTLTTNGVSITAPIVFAGVGGVLTLGSALTTTNSITHTSGTFALSTFTCTTTTGFSSNNSNTRTLAFDTGNINCSGTGGVWNCSGSTGLTVTGTPVVNISSTGSTAITVISGAFSEANAISYNFTGGTYALTFLAAPALQTAKNVNFTGFAGTWAAISQSTIYGDLTLSTGMTLTASGNTMIFGATSGTQTITSNTKTIDIPCAKLGAGTLICADALTLGSTRALTWYVGTIQLKAGVTSTIGSLAMGGTTFKSLQSTTTGTRATLSDASGTNTVTYVSIKDIAATGGATFDATSPTNVNAGNNTGWNFGNEFPGNFFFMFR